MIYYTILCYTSFRSSQVSIGEADAILAQRYPPFAWQKLKDGAGYYYVLLLLLLLLSLLLVVVVAVVAAVVVVVVVVNYCYYCYYDYDYYY